MKRIAAFFSCLVASTLCVLLGQPPVLPAFEVASVKPHEFPAGFHVIGNGGTIRISGNRVTILGNLMGLVMSAYNVRAFQVSGSPSWTDKLGRQQDYDINAKTEGDGVPSMDEVRRMLQTLLLDRFQLKLHRETKEIAVYDLEVGKNGPKLKSHVGETNAREVPSQAGSPLMRMKFSNRSIEALLPILENNVDRPVVDKTGLTGSYDFTLEFTRSNPDLVTRDGPDTDRSI